MNDLENPCVFVTGPGEVELRDVGLPELRPGQILVNGHYSLISTGTELTHVSGDFPPGSVWDRMTRYPCPIGYSHTGTIEAVGEGVDGFAVGDRVLTWASHQRYAAMDADRAVKVPDGVGDCEAAFGTLGEIALGGVRQAGITIGESAVVLGLGLVGQLTAQIARLDGARPLIAIDPVDSRRALALALGAHLGPREEGETLIERVRESTGDGADVVFDVTGHPTVMAVAVKLARQMGRVILLGSPRGPVTIDFHDDVHSRSLRIIGAHNSSHPRHQDPNHPWTIQRDTELFFRLVGDGEIAVQRLITATHPWREAPQVYRRLLADRGPAMGVLFDWSTP